MQQSNKAQRALFYGIFQFCEQSHKVQMNRCPSAKASHILSKIKQSKLKRNQSVFIFLFMREESLSFQEYEVKEAIIKYDEWI